jgi:hypothetical protein
MALILLQDNISWINISFVYMSVISDAYTFAKKFMLWVGALFMIGICSIIFFAIYGLYMLVNTILYGTNLVIFGLNMIVSPIALAIKNMIDSVDKAISGFKKFFDDLKAAFGF